MRNLIRVCLIATLLIGGLALVGLPDDAAPAPVHAQDGERTPPYFEVGDCPPGVNLPRSDAYCGYLNVLENREDPESNTIRLPVYVFPALDESARTEDALVYLSGGPGGSGSRLIQAYRFLFRQYNQTRDFVLFDQRGTGYAEPALECPDYGLANFEAYAGDYTLEEGAQIAADALLACREQYIAQGIDVNAYTSANSAADLEDLRVALGVSQWNLYGISYGSRLSMTYLRDYPENVRSIVIDGVFPPEADLYPDTPVNGVNALYALFERCESNAECNAAYPGLDTVFFEVMDDLNDSPLVMEIRNPYRGSRHEIIVDGEAFFAAMFLNLYSTEAISYMPYMIYAAQQGDFEFFRENFLGSLFVWEGVATGMHYGVNCNEEIAFQTLDDLENASSELDPTLSFFADMDNLITWRICEQWGANTPDPIEDMPIESAAPALVLAGELDPVTPPRWAELAAAGLENSFYYMVPGTGHGVSFSSRCVMGIIEQFLDAPESEPESACLEQHSFGSFEIIPVN